MFAIFPVKLRKKERKDKSLFMRAFMKIKKERNLSNFVEVYAEFLRPHAPAPCVHCHLQ